MNNDYNNLRDLMKSHGVSAADADKGIKNCIKSMAMGAVVGYYTGGAIMYFMNTNPISAAGYGTIAMGVGAGNALVNSDQCARVRQALDFWTTTND